MGRVRTKMEQDLVLRGLSCATQESYLRCAKAFIAHYKCPPERLGAAHVRQWLLYLLKEKQRKPATVNVAIGALNFLFGTTFGRPEVMHGIRSVRKELPAALSALTLSTLRAYYRQGHGAPVSPAVPRSTARRHRQGRAYCRR